LKTDPAARSKSGPMQRRVRDGFVGSSSGLAAVGTTAGEPVQTPEDVAAMRRLHDLG
jgi:hypothetical protein